MADTLSNLRTRARRRADMENSNFCPDTEVNAHINASYSELWDLLTQAFEDWFVVNNTTTIAAGSNSFGDSVISQGILKLRLIEKQLSSTTWATVPRLDNLASRNDVGGLRYHYTYGSFYFLPTTDAPGTYKVWAVPMCTTLSSDSDTTDSTIPRGWEEYVVIDAAIKMLRKEESDVSVLMAEKQAIHDRIMRVAASRDAGEAAVIRDVDNDNYYAAVPRLPPA